MGFTSPKIVDGRFQIDTLWVVNRLIDFMFVLDMVFQFLTMRKVAVEKEVEEKVEWEMDLCAPRPPSRRPMQ